MFQFAFEKALLPFQHKTPAWAELFRLPLLFYKPLTAASKAAVKVDSAFARFWWILRGGLAHYRLDKSLRPPLENPQNHRKILESLRRCEKILWRFIQKILRFACGQNASFLCELAFCGF